MKINNIGNNLNRIRDAYQTHGSKSKKESVEPADKLEISKEARELQSRKVDSKDFTVINERIQSGFYNSDKVIEKVAAAVLKEFS
ncbi:MAG: hypothetical protein GXO87_07990 [Chlorobi bacterium]|nr:hypothetical protein [Chlorobiota bacterium]